jgi:hypothetical protein
MNIGLFRISLFKFLGVIHKKKKINGDSEYFPDFEMCLDYMLRKSEDRNIGGFTILSSCALINPPIVSFLSFLPKVA